MRESRSADDLDGRTALLLLTRPSTVRRALFVSPNQQGVVSVAGGVGFYELRLNPDALPFAAGIFDSVVLDIDGLRQNTRSNTLREVYRTLKVGGTCVVAASNRRVPRDWRNWRRYHLVRSDRRWAKSLASSGAFKILNRVFARFDRQRIVELSASSDEGLWCAKNSTTDSQITVLCRRGESEDSSVLQKLIGELQARLGSSGPVRLERFLIRRIGKTTLVVASGDERRYVIRVPRSPMAADRGRCNFEALKAIHSSNLIPDQIKTMVPRPHLAGIVAHSPYYVEDLLPGTPRDDYAGWHPGRGWEPDALRFISEMHLATKRPVLIDQTVFSQFVSAPLVRIRRRCATGQVDAVCEKLRSRIERAVLGETLPLVSSHGDFAAGNCLYDEARRLSAVVDWELFSDRHLPLLDVLHCMEIPGERNSSPTWQRFDTILAMFEPDRALEIPALARYIEQIGIPRQALPALVLMYWVDHVAKRIDGRAHDRVWMDKRVLRPLSTFESIGLDTRS